MTDITNTNFDELYPDVERALNEASFIAIDTEFTGLNSNAQWKESLFDSIEERYAKLRNSISPFIVIQFGITAFRHNLLRNAYETKTFNFYLMPRCIPSKNRQFLWQVAALEFLSTNKFDFNKVIYNGITYLNKEEEAVLRELAERGELLRNIEQSVTYEDEDYLKQYVNKVGNWVTKSTNDMIVIETLTPTLQYLAHKELRRRFPNIWTTSSKKSIIVLRINPQSRATLEEREGHILENMLLESYIGFSKVFRLLSTLKKPIIGHNIFLDLLYMHQQFHKPLPKKYADFKNGIHELFPIIYDTKFLCFELQEILENKVKWKINSLCGLYKYFKDGDGMRLVLNAPGISRNDAVLCDTENYHNAGWDSYVTGYIFIKMAHIFTVKKFGDGFGRRGPGDKQIKSGVNNFVNCLNVIRGNVTYLKLDATDPPSTRPEWLYIKPLTSNNLDINQIIERFSCFGTVDVKPVSQKHALVAVSNHGSAWDILQHFRHSKEFYVVPYNPLRHSNSARYCLWGGIVLSSGIFVWMVRQTLQKTN